MAANQLIPRQQTDDLFDPDVQIAKVEKSRLELRKTVQPGVTLSGYQKKSLNALMWFVQSYCFKYFESIDKFHATLGESPLKLSIPKAHFLTMTDYGSRNGAFLKKALEEVSQVQVVYDNGETGDLENYVFMNMFKSVGVDGSRVEFEVHPETRRAIVSSEVEATIDLIKVARNLDGKYAISLYELLHSAFERMRNDVEEVQINDFDLRAGIYVPYKKKGNKKVFSYPCIGQFNSRVLKPAINEINASDFEFKLKHSFRKLGCGEVVWNFEISKTEYENFTLIANENATEVAEILDKLSSYGVRNPQEWIRKCESERELLYMLFVIEAVDKATRKKKSSIPNLGGYFVSAYNNNREAFESHYVQLLKNREVNAKRIKEDNDRQIELQKEKARNEYKARMREVNWNESDKVKREALELGFVELVVKDRFPEYLALIEKRGVHDVIAEAGQLRGEWVTYLNDAFEITDEDAQRAADKTTVKGYVK